ncbi:MAG: sigma-70 family RNA polymerase sigma factor [Solirubrobacteraceae bacterium]
MTPILARQRQDRSIERLYKKHAGDVYRYALVVLRNQADAEDVTQTTFMNAHRAMERGEQPRNPQNWLIAIAHNVCRQRFRQSQRRPAEVELNEELAEAVVEEDAISAEDIRRALGHLAFNQRAALVMRELEGRSYQEIAEILGLSVSAVETLIFRARRALREQLEEGITCHDAELAISKQLDGRLARKDKGALRAHLRECEECSHFARRQRAQRGAIKSLALIPLPGSLTSLFGGGGAATGGLALGGGLGVKLAAIGASALVVSGVSYEGVHHHILGSKPATPSAAAAQPTQKASVHPASVGAFKRLSTNDLKPYRPAAVKARGKHKGRVVNPNAKRHHEVSALPPSRERTHDLKPTHPTHPTHPTKPVHPTNTHRTPPPPKPKKPQKPPKHTSSPPPSHGKGNGKGGGGTHGNSGK